MSGDQPSRIVTLNQYFPSQTCQMFLQLTLEAVLIDHVSSSCPVITFNEVVFFCELG
jgi:hypothetical protein